LLLARDFCAYGKKLQDKNPPWRTFDGKVPEPQREPPEDPTLKRRLSQNQSDAIFDVDAAEAERVNAALYLRRPLLVTGNPGIGKSSLAYSVAYELQLGTVLRWSITSRTTLRDGLYSYDAIGRLQDKEEGGIDRIGNFITLGPLGTALLPSHKPRVLLIDEIDKSDIDLPNDLLNIFEEGEFEIPELARICGEHSEESQIPVFPWDRTGPNDKVLIENGQVRCCAFPFIIMTSNNEREFPPAFLRRCLQLRIQEPEQEKLERIVQLRLGNEAFAAAQPLIERFLELRRQRKLEGAGIATDQLLNAIYLVMAGQDVDVLTKDMETGENRLQQALFQPLTTVEDE
jgi:MoxR-like ATPase